MAALIYSLIDAKGFLNSTSNINLFILDNFGWLFSSGTSLMLLTCIVLIFHPIGKKRIGGNDAKPFLTKWRWFSIVLCTTIATGIIFWGTAEPLFHIGTPPSFSHSQPNTSEAASEAMSYMFLHWTFTPYAIYTIPALMFALAFYNKRKAFSLRSTLFPITSSRSKGTRMATLIDGICLYALVAGMAASLGAGILTLSGGIENLTSYQSQWLLLVIAGFIVAAFTLSAISGLMKGIRILSDINARIFIVLALFILVFGPTKSILNQFVSGLIHYLQDLPEMSLVSIVHSDDPWPKSWTTFYWANWLAWAPITALFLGRLSYGYTVRQFLLFNWVFPALFGMLWMSIFSGTALNFQLEGLGLSELLNAQGPESIMYRIFEEFPLRPIIAGLFLLTAFLSYVTAADSNTEAMGGISSTGISPDSPSPPVSIKVIWGITIGAVAYIMINQAGIDGIKMLSNLGGLPSLFLIVTINICLIYLLISKKYKSL